MSERAPEEAPPAGAEPGDAEVPFGPTPELIRAAREALAEMDTAAVEGIVRPLHPADLANLIEQLSGEERQQLLAIVGGVIDPETLSHLDEKVREAVLERLGTSGVAAAVRELDTDDAVDLLGDLDEEAKRRILAAVPGAERAVLEEGLTFPEDSAGRLMQREVVTVPSYWTVGETIDFLRAKADLPDDFYDLFIVDPTFRPMGSVPLSRAMRAKRAVKLTDIMEGELRTIPAAMDQEQVAYVFRQYALVSAPVVDDAGRLLGVVTVDDVVRVIQAETEEDLLGLAGVGESDFHAPAAAVAWRRMRWLVVTLINTIIASAVILQFDSTIEELVALAVLMPIVAAMGGNAGMQVVTVTVRALATRDLTPGSNLWRNLAKEMLIAAANAAAFAVFMGTAAALWFHSPSLGAVLGAAMVFNMMWAGLAGSFIPMALARLGFDPAIAAGPFLTTTTDVLGFFSFLGLATLFLL